MPIHTHHFWTIQCRTCARWLTPPGNPPATSDLFAMRFFNPFAVLPFALLAGWTHLDGDAICPACTPILHADQKEA